MEHFGCIFDHIINENNACQFLWGVEVRVWVAGLATGLFRFIHTRRIAQPQILNE